MAKKCNKLLGNKIMLGFILAGVFLFGVIRLTPNLYKSLSTAQELQRTGKHSSLQDASTFLLLVCLTTMVYIICNCIMYICIEINRRIKEKRRKHQDFLKKDCEKRILRKILFEEIKGELPMPDEEELWETLGELTTRELEEAREERKQLLYEMEEKALGG